MIDFALLIRDHFHLLGAGDWSTYETMAATWYHKHPDTGADLPGPPSEEECIAAWPGFVEAYNVRAVELAAKRNAGETITPWEARHFPALPDRKTGVYTAVLLTP